MWSVYLNLPKGRQFTLNCYHHWSTHVVHNVYGSGYLFHSKEVVTQEGPLFITAYIIGIFLLICELRDAHPHYVQPTCR